MQLWPKTGTQGSSTDGVGSSHGQASHGSGCPAETDLSRSTTKRSLEMELHEVGCGKANTLPHDKGTATSRAGRRHGEGAQAALHSREHTSRVSCHGRPPRRPEESEGGKRGDVVQIDDILRSPLQDQGKGGSDRTDRIVGAETHRHETSPRGTVKGRKANGTPKSAPEWEAEHSARGFVHGTPKIIRGHSSRSEREKASAVGRATSCTDAIEYPHSC